MKLIYILLLALSYQVFSQEYTRYKLVPPFDTVDWAKYLDKNQRKEYEIEIKDGRLYRNGKVYSTTTKSSKAGIFVISEDKKLYISHQHDQYRFRHSSFLSGQSILSAGEIIVHKGKIIVMNNNSGHYLPSADSIRSFQDILASQGYEEIFGTHPYEGVTRPLEIRYNSYNLKELLSINFCNFLLM